MRKKSVLTRFDEQKTGRKQFWSDLLPSSPGGANRKGLTFPP